MDNIKAILFDYDGVMTLDKTGTETICNYISNTLGIDKSIFEKEYRKYNKDLLYGKPTSEIWEELCKNINKNIPLSILYDSYKNTPINMEMHELVLKIKDKNIKTGLITDNKADRIDHINKIFNLDKYFDIISVSGKLGYGKESDKIFIKTLEELKIKPEESIFIDNHENNLIIPKKMRIKKIYFNDEEKDMAKLIYKIRKKKKKMKKAIFTSPNKR
jgi:putative hydrolase of the HAD superfamily